MIDRHPRMAGESVSADELVEDINRYRKTLDKFGRKFPQPFILQDVIDIAAQKVVFLPEELAKKDREAACQGHPGGQGERHQPRERAKRHEARRAVGQTLLAASKTRFSAR